MNALVSHAPGRSAGQPTARLRLAAALVDLAVAAVFALIATAAALAAVIGVAMALDGAFLPLPLALIYLAFPIFEFLFFTPVGFVAPVTAAGVALVFWMSRRGWLALPSPGTVLLTAPVASRG